MLIQLLLFSVDGKTRLSIMERSDENMKEELLTIRDHIIYLRHWLGQQQPILNSLDTDEFLLRFLRVTDFRLEFAKQGIINFWRYRAESPLWFVIVFQSLKCAFLYLGFKIVIYSKILLCVKSLSYPIVFNYQKQPKKNIIYFSYVWVNTIHRPTQSMMLLVTRLL